ncbi:MAG TPA: WhiB family transcriptional regulator [Armatimonadota bacterium]|nr:WhiB family transcriptional regulator [Armatimonadota bacterium]
MSLASELEALEALERHRGAMEEVEREKAEQALLDEYRPSPEALRELAYADWAQKAAPRFAPGERAACEGHPHPDWWFSGLVAERAEASSLCAACPARQTCYTASELEDHGIWGGEARDSLRLDVLCPHGHSNWRIYPETGRRKCLTCRQEADRDRRARLKALKEAA